jgi:hypothetical protein
LESPTDFTTTVTDLSAGSSDLAFTPADGTIAGDFSAGAPDEETQTSSHSISVAGSCSKAGFWAPRTRSVEVPSRGCGEEVGISA